MTIISNYTSISTLSQNEICSAAAAVAVCVCVCVWQLSYQDVSLKYHILISVFASLIEAW